MVRSTNPELYQCDCCGTLAAIMFARDATTGTVAEDSLALDVQHFCTSDCVERAGYVSFRQAQAVAGLAAVAVALAGEPGRMN